LNLFDNINPIIKATVPVVKLVKYSNLAYWSS
jgi:hypothetical protein